jgi:hypothetical protein
MRKAKKTRQSGQAVLEFLVIMTVLITLIFMFVQISYGIAWGHYVQYATYMSSRALFSSGLNQQTQIDSAKSVLEKMVKAKDGSGKELVSFVAQSRSGEERDIKGTEAVPGAFIGMHPVAEKNGPTTRFYAWAEGVQYNYQVPVFLMPLAQWIVGGKGKTITTGSPQEPGPSIVFNGKLPFTSDSWLGREISIDECLKDMQSLSQDPSISRTDGADFIYDNGC